MSPSGIIKSSPDGNARTHRMLSRGPDEAKAGKKKSPAAPQKSPAGAFKEFDEQDTPENARRLTALMLSISHSEETPVGDFQCTCPRA